MCEPTTIAAAVMVVGAAVGAVSAKKNADAQKRGLDNEREVQEHNARIGDMQARDAIDRGIKTEQNQRLKINAIRESAKARYAAAGLDIGEGSPLNVLLSTDYVGDIDISTIRENASKEAWFYRENASNSLRNANFYGRAAGSVNPDQAAATSLLGSASSAASTWYTYGKRA